MNWAYIAGFLDGDGWITFSKNKNCKTYTCVVGFTQVATRVDFMRDLYTFLKNNDINGTFIERDSKNNIDPKGYTKMVNIHIKEIKSVILILENMLPFLMIKKEKAKDAIKYLKTKQLKSSCENQLAVGYKDWNNCEIKK